MMSKIGLIINSSAKFFRENECNLDLLRAKAASNSSICDLIITRSLSDVKNAIKKHHRDKKSILAIAGGDGTYQNTISELIGFYGQEELPKIALLRGGTMNTFATSLKIRGNPQTLLSKLFKMHKNNEAFSSVKRSLLKVDDRYGFIFGNGIFPNFLKIYHERAYPSITKGFILLLKSIISAFFNTKFAKQVFIPFRCILTFKDQTVNIDDCSCITCSTIPYIGYGFRFYSSAVENNKSFHLVTLPSNPKVIAHNIHKFYSGKLKDIRGVFEVNASEVLIKTDSPIDYQLDGEIVQGKSSFVISLGPCIDFITL